MYPLCSSLDKHKVETFRRHFHSDKLQNFRTIDNVTYHVPTYNLLKLHVVYRAKLSSHSVYIAAMNNLGQNQISYSLNHIQNIFTFFSETDVNPILHLNFKTELTTECVNYFHLPTCFMLQASIAMFWLSLIR
jgi:hypothetical protein